MFPKQATRSRIRHAMRLTGDTFAGRRFVSPSLKTQPEMPVRIVMSHPFKPSETLDNKKHNLRQAAERINCITLLPGQMFSFWRAVGNPNDRSRFREGRSIHGDRTSYDLGGGLCQASGLIHHVALLARLEVIERHNHSIDLYTDETRFAPLGTDATVFYGYKDLRLRNNLDSPLRFRMTVHDDRLELALLTEARVAADELRTVTDLHPDGSKEVTVFSSSGRPLSHSLYKPLISTIPDEYT